MGSFDSYSNKYPNIAMRREEGILEVRLHSDGESVRWHTNIQRQLLDAYSEIGADRNNRVIIITGTGNEFIGPRHDGTMYNYQAIHPVITPAVMDEVHWDAKRMIARFLEIEVPCIGVMNGPALRHSGTALMCDIVIASEDATIEDTSHFTIGNNVPGDGIAVILTMLMGLNRARYLMLTGQVLSAQQALALGLVAELLPRDKLLDRAWVLAREIAKKPDLLLRHTRLVLTHPLKKMMDEMLPYHLTLESMGGLEKAEINGLTRGDTSVRI